MSILLEDAGAIEMRSRANECAPEIVPGTSVGSFPTMMEAYAYLQFLGLRGYTVTSDTMLGWSVRKLMPISQQAPLRTV